MKYSAGSNTLNYVHSTHNFISTHTYERVKRKKEEKKKVIRSRD